ncbi:GGDEF domain-containing protein, partial [Cyanobium sp. FGCU-52]|nr:GGDEF domain-containing protein [Cyanobium sp. FGCU52]
PTGCGRHRPLASARGFLLLVSEQKLAAGRSNDQSLLGVFGMYYPDTRLPSSSDLELVDHMTHLATLAAERHRRDEERRRQAMEDALTGLGNRHLLQTQAGELVSRAQEAQQPLCLLFLDLDHFKLFNDNFGHLLGDKLLLQFSGKLKEALPRPSCWLASVAMSSWGSSPSPLSW